MKFCAKPSENKWSTQSIYRDTTAVLIKDLDHAVNADEIKIAVSKDLYGDSRLVDLIEINELRKPTPGRALTVVAVLPAADATKNSVNRGYKWDRTCVV